MMKNQEPVSDTPNKLHTVLEISVTFIHPFTDAKIEGLVSPSITANDIIFALAGESFIPLPIDYNGSPRYVLSVESGGQMNGSDTLADVGATDGCVVHVIAVCSDDETDCNEREKEKIESYETAVSAADSKICVRFLHPTTAAVLEATVSPTITANEIISVLISEKFLAEPIEGFCHLHYCLGTEDGAIKGTDTLRDAGVTDGCLIRISSGCVGWGSEPEELKSEDIPVHKPEISVKFVHPTTGAVLEAAVSPTITADEVIHALMRELFLPQATVWYRLAIGDNRLMEGNCVLWNAGVTEGCNMRIIPVFWTELENNGAQETTAYSEFEPEITVTFVHPTTALEMEVLVDSILAADEAITKLIRLSFLEYSWSVGYSLELANGFSMKGTDTFRDVDATDGCKVRIIQTAVGESSE